MWRLPKRRVYLDWAAAAPVLPSVKHTYMRALGKFGNPGALHEEAREARELLADARIRIARLAEVKPSGVIFTSGATEANALAILGRVRAVKKQAEASKKLHVLYHPAAHASIRGVMEQLEEEGVLVEALHLTGSAPDHTRIQSQLRPETVLVALEAVSGETGERYDTLAIRRELDVYAKKENVRIYLHVDATQAPLTLSYTLAQLGADSVALDAQKVGGVRGIGALLLRSTQELTPLIRGGGQEQGLRPGTESPALALAFAEALENCHERRERFMTEANHLRDRLCARLAVIPDLVRNEAVMKVPNILNVSCYGRDTDYAVMLLDTEGYAISTKSACETEEAGSRAVRYMTGDEKRSTTTLRISWGPETTEKELIGFADALIRTVRFLDEKAIY